MSKVFIEETTLTSIGSAIREMTGKTDLIAPGDMPAEIRAIETGGGSGVIEALEITNNGTYTAADGVDGYSPITVNVPQDGAPTDSELTIKSVSSYRFANGGWDWFIRKYGNRMTTAELWNADYMFWGTGLTSIPFDLNFQSDYSTPMNQMFSSAMYLETVPKVNNVKPEVMNNMFNYCWALREIPEDWCDTWDWSEIEGSTYSSANSRSSMFSDCYSLRSFPKALISHENPTRDTTYGSLYNSLFNNCYSLDAVNGLYVIPATLTSNMFGSSFLTNCHRVKSFTFAPIEGTVNWSNQTINLWYLGYAPNTKAVSNIVKYNSGIYGDKQVTDAETYAALKDDPDWYSADASYGRYNHDSAVETINSLPATSGTGCILQLNGTLGSKTDGGAINTLTEEEIAVATAKGWSVSM